MKIRKEFIIGVVALFTIIASYWGFSLLKGEDLFSRENEYICIYDRVAGLAVSNPVNLNGLRVGKVSYVDFIPGDSAARVMVKIKINDDLQIPALTLAVIKSDLLGVNSIELRYRKSDSYAKNGDTLSTIVATTIQEEVSMQMMPIKVKAEGMMSSLDSILSAIKYVFNKDSQKNLSDAIERIKSTIINLEKSSKGLDVLMTEQSGRLDRILSNVENITANLKNNSGQIDNIIGNFSQLSDSLAQINIQNTFSKLDNSLVEFEQIVSKINRGEGTVGQLVHNDSLYVELEAASKELHLLLEDVRLNPKRYVRVSVFGGKNNDSYVAPNKQPE